ncbi:MAG: choline kinase [Paracrocinitomix sp.]|jgi:choline kinase
MNSTRSATSTKAVILAAGLGSRIRPLTDNVPKSLLTIGDTTILERMLKGIYNAGISDVILVLGYMSDKIEHVVQHSFPDMNVEVVINERYSETNTGYSLLLAADPLAGSAFVKFDADVVFDTEILRLLLACPHENALCIDRNIQLACEEVKVALADGTKVARVSKLVAPADAIGESIGIEKIGSATSSILFAELRSMMEREQNLQEYYEGAYERLIDRGVAFHAIDITGMAWTEIDTLDDYAAAEKLFG